MTTTLGMSQVAQKWPTDGDHAKLWQNSEVRVFLQANPDIRDLANTICQMAVEQFHGADVIPSIGRDPETGRLMLYVSVAHQEPVERARAAVREFLDALPEGANCETGLIDVSVFRRR